MSVKRLKGFFRKFDLFYTLRYSSLFLKMDRFFRPRILKGIHAETTLYKSIFNRSNLHIFDVGANEGYTTEALLPFSENIICLEPEEQNIKALQARYKNNSKVKVLGKAVSEEIGQSRLFIESTGSTLHTLSDKWKTLLENPDNDRWQKSLPFNKSIQIETTTLDSLIEKYGAPDYIKIDVEGYEYEVIKGLSKSIPLISFEANLPEFLEESVLCVNRLLTIDERYRFNYSVFDNLELEKYLKGPEFIAYLKKTKLRYMDVFCQLS